MKKPATPKAMGAPADEELEKRNVQPHHIARALSEATQKKQSAGGLFAIRLFGKFGWSGPRRLADGSSVH